MYVDIWSNTILTHQRKKIHYIRRLRPYTAMYLHNKALGNRSRLFINNRKTIWYQ